MSDGDELLARQESVQRALDDLLEEKLKTKDGTAKVANYAAAYLRDRARYFGENNNESDAKMLGRCAKILKACQGFLEEK